MGLEKKSFPKTKQWMVDQDYTKTLSPEEKEWLGRFNQEYYRNRFESPELDLHKTKKQRKECNLNDNANRRDLLTIEDLKCTVERVQVRSEEYVHVVETLPCTLNGYDLVDAKITLEEIELEKNKQVLAAKELKTQIKLEKQTINKKAGLARANERRKAKRTQTKNTMEVTL